MNKIIKEAILTKQCRIFLHVCNFVKFVFIELASWEARKVLLLKNKENNLWYNNDFSCNYIYIRIV